MPYIPADQRPALDAGIDALAGTILELSDGDPADAAGLVNYSVTRILATVMPVERYWHAALSTGVIENVKQELYRRAIASYEDDKIAENGDVPEYEGR